MRALVYSTFGDTPTIETVPDPQPRPDGVVVKVVATGVCRSDWHGWMGHDADITLPHVPGHELAGTVTEVGTQVRNWQIGDRVSVPFVGGCGTCPECLQGDHQVCRNQFQPGFTHWGSFADYVAIGFADTNLVRLPDDMNFVAAASLGCRFATSFRAIVDQARVESEQWVVVHGCGGVGLSAVAIAHALGARVIAVDIEPTALQLALELGAEVTLDGADPDLIGVIRELTSGGAHASLDAFGSPTTCTNSIRSLRRRGKHIQVGLMPGEHANTPLPLDRIISWELEILGSHGMAAHRYPDMLKMISDGRLDPRRLVTRTISLDESVEALITFPARRSHGMTVIDLGENTAN